MKTTPSTIRHSVRIFATLISAAVVSMMVADIQAATWTPTATGTTYSWQTAGNWDTNPSPAPSGQDVVASLTNNIAGAQTISLNGTVTLGTLNIGDSTTPYFGFTLQNGTGGSLTFDVASGSAAINKTGNGTTTTDTISATISLKTNLNVTNSSSSRLTISGAIGENSSGKSITIASGINDLNNASNSFTGGVNINGGSQLYAGSLANAGSNSALGNSGTIALGSVATTGLLGFSSLSANSTTDRTVDLAGTTGGGSILSSANYAVKFTGNFTASGAGSKTLNLRGTNTGNNEVSGAIVDNSSTNKTSISKTDAGTWIVSGPSSYTGGVSVGAGTLSFTSVADTNTSSALGAAGTIKIGSTTTSGTLNYTGTGTSSSNRTVDLAGTTGGATINANGSGTLKFTSNFTASGAGNKTLTLGGNNTGANEISGAIVNSSGGNTTSVTKADAGNWILSGTNTYSGTTLVTAGTLVVNGSLSNTTSTSVNNGALAGTGTIATGVTIGDGTGGSGTAFLAPGADGTIGQITTGALSLNNSDAAFKFDLNTTAHSYDKVVINGTLTLGAGLAQFTGTDLGSGTLTNGTVITLATSTGISGTFSGLADGATYSLGSNTYKIYYGTYAGHANDLVLVVPEPATWALLAFSLTTVVVLRRRRNS